MADGCRQENARQSRVSSSARSSAPPRSERARQADGRCCRRARVARPLDRAAHRREHRQARTRARCRSSTNRSGGRTSTATIARSSRSRPIADDRDARRLARARSRRPSGAAPDHAARRARRRVLPLGVRHGGRRRRSRDQPVRRAERLGGQGEDQGAPRRATRPPGDLPDAADRVADNASTSSASASPAARRRPSSARRSLARAAGLRRVSLVPAARQRCRAGGRRDVRAGHPRARHAASTFGVGPRYLHSTGQYHKGGPNTALAFVLTADDETRDRDSGGGLHVLGR